MNTATISAILLVGIVFVGSVSLNDAYGAVFAKYDGIDGESDDDKHGKWIDTLSLDWGAHQTTDKKGRTMPVIEDLTITMDYDKASPKLLEAIVLGKVIPKLEIELTATYGGVRETYLKYELINVMVTSYQTNASGNDEAGPPTVVIGNNFEEVKVTYTEYDNTGAKKGNVETQFKVEKGAK